MFTRLELTNFTVFKQLSIEFSSGVNVLVGANGTGKTHLMKLLYCIQEALTPNGKPINEKLVAVFRPNPESIHRLTRFWNGANKTDIHASWNGQPIDASWNVTSADLSFEPPTDLSMESPVFIPAKEFLSFAPGFSSLYNKYKMDVDEVYYDILKLAYLPLRRSIPDARDQEILETIQYLIGGRVTTEGERFFISTARANLEMHLVAEGHRKLALIWQLINNGSLMEGSTLFWDEPEANLNPSMMQHVAKILLLLADRGIQVFAASHDYSFLKEIDLHKEQTQVTYFALNDTGSEGVEVNTSFRYSTITPNKIAEEYLRLFDQEMQKAFKGGSQW
jgi:ABC-type lipoprotein export system ATPase subunit